MEEALHKVMAKMHRRRDKGRGMTAREVADYSDLYKNHQLIELGWRLAQMRTHDGLRIARDSDGDFELVEAEEE
ncbi:hypothetical protein QIS99_31195 [Streptomyces sp. B-S-A8]|uniref:Uncharacterized protein n=1 Tax=Streptomyces solicavernae TaxID=3043614 RepID=A0ABT6S1W5_9ACTN|nr:hypothetical protein [Streptomyces sp. B-S-A8]MDI3390628.1 hypothetical protein [Streptomyces sp. B-S-A8]